MPLPAPQRRRRGCQSRSPPAAVAPPPHSTLGQGRVHTGISSSSSSPFPPQAPTPSCPHRRCPWPPPARHGHGRHTPPCGAPPLKLGRGSTPSAAWSLSPLLPSATAAQGRRPGAAAARPSLPLFPVKGGGRRWRICQKPLPFSLFYKEPFHSFAFLQKNPFPLFYFKINPSLI